MRLLMLIVVLIVSSAVPAVAAPFEEAQAAYEKADYTTAVAWYRKAAEQGDAGGQYSLGLMYFDGHGVPQDFAQAHMWFNLAAAQGDAEAAKSRDRVAARMTPAQLAEVQKLAREWYSHDPLRLTHRPPSRLLSYRHGEAGPS